MSERETFSTVPAVSSSVETQAVEASAPAPEPETPAVAPADGVAEATPVERAPAPVAEIETPQLEATAPVESHAESVVVEATHVEPAVETARPSDAMPLTGHIAPEHEAAPVAEVEQIVPPVAAEERVETPPIATDHVVAVPVTTEHVEVPPARQSADAPVADAGSPLADAKQPEAPRDPRAPRTVGFDRSVEERKQRAEQHWLHVSGARETGEALEGLVTATVKGGLLVDVGGVRGFLPASQTRLEAGAALESLVKTKVPLCVIDVDAKRRRIVVSQRRALDDLRRSKRTALLRSLQIGQLHEGVVVRLAPFGAFVDIGGLEGLVPMSELAFERVERVEDVLKVGERVPVTVLRLDESGKKIGLSRKNALPDPLRDHAALLRTGNIIEGKVVGKDTRLEVEIAPGVIGSVRESDADPAQYEIGETVEVSVRYVDRRNRRIVLTTLHGAAAVAPQNTGFASLGEELRRRK